MKLKIATALVLAVFCACQSAKGGLMRPAMFTMDEIHSAYRASRGGVWYPRMITLANGEWVCGFDTNEDGGNSVIKVIVSNDLGVSWSPGIVAARRPGADLANAQLVQRGDGELWLAYRMVEHHDGRYTTSLRISRSHDNGRTWEELPNGEIARETSDQFKGVWEPHMGYMGDSFVCMYANDNFTVIDHGGQQSLFMKTWTGKGWSDPIVVSDGRESNGRDGMPVWSRMKDGRYIAVFETSDENARYPFVVKYKISPDGFNWDVPRHTLYTPERKM
ncbi:MAG: glycoside hydrolase, partial [Treponema sp.]|nr:glycoside hydrolase [Treponema sp.]